jgi:hypothetical protein
MEHGVGRWLAPMGASAAVLGVFVVPGLVAAATDRSGPDGGVDTRLSGVVEPHDPITPVLPPQPIEQVGRSERAVEVTGYQSAGRTLTLYYTVDQSTDCSARIDPPLVRERPTTVIVFVQRQVSRAPNQVCTHLSLANSVTLALHVPLGDRVVQDGGYDGSLVPFEPRTDGSVIPTPPVGRAGR